MPTQRDKPRATFTPLRSVMDALVSEYNQHTGHSNTLRGSTSAAFNYFLRTYHEEHNQAKSFDTITDVGADVKASGRTERAEPAGHTERTTTYIRNYSEPTRKNSADKIATATIDAAIYIEAEKIIAAYKPYANMTKRYVGSLVIEFFTEHLRRLKHDTPQHGTAHTAHDTPHGMAQGTARDKYNTPQEQPNTQSNETSAVNALDVSTPTLNTSAHATHTQHLSGQDRKQDTQDLSEQHTTEQHLSRQDEEDTSEQNTPRNKHNTPQEQPNTQSGQTDVVNAADHSNHNRHNRAAHIAEIYHNRILDALDAADRGVRVVDHLGYIIQNATDWIIAIHDEGN